VFACCQKRSCWTLSIQNPVHWYFMSLTEALPSQLRRHMAQLQATAGP
jgi:hypothetical protein